MKTIKEAVEVFNERDVDIDDEHEVDLAALAQALDTSWGRSSTPKTASYSVKFSLGNGPVIRANYAAIVNFGNEQEMIVMKRRYASESKTVTEALLKHIRSLYNEITGKTLKVTEHFTQDSIELLSMAVFNPRRQAYFRRQTIYTLK